MTDSALQGWADENGVQLKLIQGGNRTQNAYVGSFNARFRDECPNEHDFRNLARACAEELKRKEKLDGRKKRE